MNWQQILKIIEFGGRIGSSLLPPPIGVAVNVAVSAAQAVDDALNQFAALNNIPPEQLRETLLAEIEKELATAKQFANESRERIQNG